MGPSSSSFVARAAEMKAIAQAAAKVERGRTQFVLIQGAAETGKTALVRQCLDALESWEQYGISLNPDFRRDPGSAVLAITGVRAPYRITPDSVDRYLEAVGRRTQPTVVTVDGLEDVDSVSAEIFFQGLSVLERGPAMIIMTSRPSTRPDVMRLVRLAQSSPHGLFLSLDTLSDCEIRGYIAALTGIHVSDEIVGLIKDVTDGYPRTVKQVARWLAERPLGTRSIQRALLEVLREPDYQDFLRKVASGIETSSRQARRLLHILAVARRPLRKEALDALAGDGVDLDALLSTQAIKWDSTRFGYVLTHRSMARALRAELSHEQEAQVHRSLLEFSSGIESYGHRVSAMKLSAGPESHPDAESKLYSDLITLASEALQSGERGRGFEFARQAAKINPTAKALSLVAQMSRPTGDFSELLRFETSVRALEPSSTQAALTALLVLQRDDGSSALEYLRSAAVPEGDFEQLPVFAQAVSELGGNLAVRGDYARAVDLLEQTLRALDSWERHVREEADLATALSPDGDSGMQHRVGYIRTLRGPVQLWHLLATLRPDGDQPIVSQMDALIAELELYPGTGFVRDAMRSARGTWFRQQGLSASAFADLLPAASLPETNSYTIHARAQLALLLFSAGYWDEAHRYAHRALGSTLAVHEDGASYIAHAVAALIPAARGSWDEAATVIAQLKSAPSPSPVVAMLCLWAEAWRAIAAGEDEEAAQSLMKIRSTSRDWWTVGPEPLGMLIRQLHYGGWPEMIPGVIRSTVQGAEEHGLSGLLNYACAFQAWRDKRPDLSMKFFQAHLRVVEETPTLRASQYPGEGGGFRLYRALTGLDIAQLFAEFPDELRVHRSSVLELLVWSSALFRDCGAKRLHEKCVDLTESIRPRVSRTGATLVSGPGPGREVADVPPEAGPALGRKSVHADQGVGQADLSDLSSRERMIASAVARGLTNREIAEELVISVRTVEFHVSNVLGKLSLDSRRELRRLLRG